MIGLIFEIAQQPFPFSINLWKMIYRSLSTPHSLLTTKWALMSLNYVVLCHEYNMVLYYKNYVVQCHGNIVVLCHENDVVQCHENKVVICNENFQMS